MLKKLSFLISISIIILFILSSCSLQKRHYRQGYHIAWSKSKNKQPETVKSSNETTSEKIILSKKTLPPSSPESTETILASNNNGPRIVMPIKKIKLTIKELPCLSLIL